MELTGWSRKQKGKQFLISLIQMLWFILICCKIQSYLTKQGKLTLAESCHFLVVVNTGKYVFRVYQIPNHTLSYCQGTTLCGYFQPSHKATFYAPTCFSHPLWPSSGNYNIMKTPAVYHVSYF